MEAMKKLDAKLVAYLAGEKLVSNCNVPNMEEAEEQQAAAELCSTPSLASSPQQLELFKKISGIKLQMEALTLQPEGTKRMELLQNDIRPIFTVECQLSPELIEAVPRYDMFHIMQFESEKFQSLTQCTRFGQEDQRAVKLNVSDEDVSNVANNNNQQDVEKQTEKENENENENENEKENSGNKPNFGCIHFTVWWREPGTCLNEMLGMGVLALEELYAASLLEQCKRIVIQRRKVHLANLYFKITLLIGGASEPEAEQQQTPTSLSTAKEASSVHLIGGEQRHETSSADGVKTNEKDGSIGSNSNNNANDKNAQVETTHFMTETSRVRLLRGLIHANEVRHLDLNEDRDYLVCRRFWEDDLAVTTAVVDNKFNYQEQFAVLNDDAFLRRVERQYLQLELWRRQSSDGSENRNDAPANVNDLRPLGVVRLPLHQFFIAYRDVAITNHLCKGKLPVVSFDAWAPITSFAESGAGQPIGEMRCMLAIGSDEQIAKLKETHGYCDDPSIGAPANVVVDKAMFMEYPSPGMGHTAPREQLQSTADLLGLLQRSLTAPEAAAPGMPSEATKPTTTKTVTPSLVKPLQMPNVKSFRFLLEIQRAHNLPRNPAVRGTKKSSKRNSANKQQRFPPNEAPSTYVTFQADEGSEGPTYKSHEGAVYATNIVEKSTQPQWQQRFRISVSVDYLLNPQKRFILKIWKKAATDSPQKRQQQPSPLEDAIIGFAALDLGVFPRGLYLDGCFNIVDFNGRINGQLEVRSQPLEDVQQLINASLHPISNPPVIPAANTNIDSFIDEFDSTLGLAHSNLGQAIKRKFTELEDISQRLRSRLRDVTGEQIAPEFNASLLDSWQADIATDSNANGELDEFDEFERDINTVPPPPPTSSLDLVAASPPPNPAGNKDSPGSAQNDMQQMKIASNTSASFEVESEGGASKSMTSNE